MFSSYARRNVRLISLIRRGFATTLYCNQEPKLVTTHLDDQNGVYYIGLNSPAKRNAVDQETARQLHDAFNTFNECKEALVGILFGNGGTFCAGFDLKKMHAAENKSVEEIDEHFQGIAPMGPSRMRIKKPVIAAMSGYAVAGGLELALLCDLRIMEEDAIVGVFCRRFGVPLIDGGTVRLPKLIGLSRALDLILTGRGVTAKEALKIGLANRVVPRGGSLKEATKIALQLAKFPQKCLLADRESAYYATFNAESLEHALEFEYKNGLKVVTCESVQGANAFVSGKGKHGEFD